MSAIKNTKRIRFKNPKKAKGNFESFCIKVIKKASKATGVSYKNLVRDIPEKYSSAAQAMQAENEFKRHGNTGSSHKHYRNCESCQTMVEMVCRKTPGENCGYQPIYSFGESNYHHGGGVSGIRRSGAPLKRPGHGHS